LIKILATAVFRKLTPMARTLFVDEFFAKTGLYFNIIDQALENFYLELAMTGKWVLSEPVLLINIGGGSTELVVMNGKEAIERQNIDLGVGTILTQFQGINDPVSEVGLEEVVNWVKLKLPKLSNKVSKAFYTGGELNYMRLTGYKLAENSLFKDSDHPSIINIVDLSRRNAEVFGKVKLEELEKLMPENPSWMHGARGCSAITQAICENYGIEVIIPSDSNLINGVVRAEDGI